MSITREGNSDSRRDAKRYYRLLRTVEHATRQVRNIEAHGRSDIDEVLNSVLPSFAEALNAERAFVAVLQEDRTGQDGSFELTAVYPREDLVGHRLERSELLEQLLVDGKPKVIDPLGEDPPRLIPGLEIFDGTSAVLVRMEVGDPARVVGVCNKADPDLGPYLASDGIALDNIVELLAIGIRVGGQRSRELKGIQSTTAAISAELDLNELLPMIARKAAEVFKVPATSLMLWDEEGTNLVIKASWGLSDEYVQQQRIPREKAYAGIAPNGEFLPFSVVDLRLKPFGRAELVRRENLCSALVIPLEVAGEPIGALNIYTRDTPRQFTRNEEELASIFGHQAVIAIQNAQQYTDTEKARIDAEKARKRLETVAAVGEAVSSTLDFEEFVDTLLTRLGEVIEAPNRGLLLYDEALDVLVIHSSSHYAIDPDEADVRGVKVGEGITGWVAQRREPCNVPDVSQDSRYLGFISTTRSELVVPVVCNGKLFAVINLESPQVGAFDEDDVALLLAIADQVAIALKNVQQHEETSRRNQHWQALYEASKAITTGFAAKRKAVLDRIVEQAVERISGVEGPKALWGSVQLYDEESKRIRFESVYPPEVYSELEQRLVTSWLLDRSKAPGGVIGISGRAVLEKKPQRVGDVRIDSDYLEAHPATKSELEVPLLDSDRVIGVLSVESDQVGAFDQDDERALVGLAELAVIAIKNAEQVEQLSRARAVALLGAWGAEIAHDVNREAGTIRLAISSLLCRSDLSEDVRQRLEEIDRYAEQLGLPALPEGAPEPGQIPEFRDAPLLDEVMESIIEETSEELAEEQYAIEIASDLGCPGARVAMHPYWLSRVTHHLVWNAIQAMASDDGRGRATVRTSVRDCVAWVEVEDTGNGVPPEVEPLLFRQPVPRAYGRQGRGLLLVSYIVELHGGSAFLVSSRPEEGACFAFSVPLARRSEQVRGR